MDEPGKGDLSARYCDGPLQFIRIDETGNCQLEENAASLLSQIQGRVAVVGIAGLYRTGKSFLLNRLMGLQDGFEIGPSVNPCTKGLWVWGQPVQIEADYYCIFVDTEGLGSTQRTASCDMQIFSLCILLSSYFIYNSIGAIDDQAIDDLHLVLNIAKHVHVRSEQGNRPASANELAEYFPSLHWALRDFHLEPINDRGEKMSEKDYLEEALMPIPRQDDKNKLREVIKDLFRERSCTTLPRPCSNEADLRQIQRMPYESLRPQFRMKVEEFVKSVYGSLKPKTFKGVHMSGAMFVELASEYCNAINGGGVPIIHSAWTSVLQHQLRLSLHDAVKIYETCMKDNALQHLPMKEDTLRGIHKQAKADAVSVFMTPKFDANDGRFLEYREELANRIKGFFEHVQAENLSASRHQCEQSAQELYSLHIAPKLEGPTAYQGLDGLLQDWDRVHRIYLETTAGPAQAEVLSKLLFQRMAESTHHVWAVLQDRNNEQLEELQQRLLNEKTTSEEQSKRLREAERDWQARQSELDKNLEETRMSIERSARQLEPQIVTDPERNCNACVVA